MTEKTLEEKNAEYIKHQYPGWAKRRAEIDAMGAVYGSCVERDESGPRNKDFKFCIDVAGDIGFGETIRLKEFSKEGDKQETVFRDGEYTVEALEITNTVDPGEPYGPGEWRNTCFVAFKLTWIEPRAKP